jgi:AraC-like DNA-binding protein
MVEYSHFREPDENARPVLGARFRIGGSYTGPFHSHRKAQLFFATEGVITVDARDGLWVTPPHRGVWIPSEVEHTVRGTGIKDINCIYIEPEFASRMPGTCSVIGVTPLLREMILRVIAIDEEFEDRRAAASGGRETEKAEGEASSQRPAGSLDASPPHLGAGDLDLLRAAMLEELRQAPRDPGMLPMPTERRVRRVVEAMIQQPGSRRTLAEWGAIVGASQRTLARLFLRETGVSFGQWRQQLDVALAVQMLCSGEPVQRVADRLGYDTPSAFIAMFRRVMGRTPARYAQEVSAIPTG